MSHHTPAGEKSAADPRPVTRGSNLQLGHLGLDSLYLVVEYAHSDVYDTWAGYLGQADNPNLYAGVLADDMVIRTGGHGYKFSVWDGDARLFLTDRVEHNLAGTGQEGQGMGMLLQLGPKWLTKYYEASWPKRFIEHVSAQLAAFGVRGAESYPIRLNRADIAVDVIGLAVAELSVDEWRAQWVGYSRPSDVHYSRQTGNLETIAVGTSSGKVRFKVYDKVAESVKRGSATFWRSCGG